jgi:hypothetical protein
MELQQELDFFNTYREKWVQEHKGKFALIKGTELIGAFDTAENAYVAGVERFGNVPFLIKQVLEKEPEGHIPALTSGLLRAHS